MESINLQPIALSCKRPNQSEGGIGLNIDDRNSTDVAVKDPGRSTHLESALSSPLRLVHFALARKGDTGGTAEFLDRSGQGTITTLWHVAHAISEIVPDGEKEKRLVQSLLNQRDRVEQPQDLLF